MKHTQLILSVVVAISLLSFASAADAGTDYWEGILVTMPGTGGASQVRTLDNFGDPKLTPGFYTYAENLHTGFNVATGDLNGDGSEEIIVAPKAGGAPQVRIFDELGNSQFTPGFYAYAENLRCGVDVAAGDLNGDGRDEIITIPGEGCSGQVRIFNYIGEPVLSAGFFAYATNVRSGFRVTSGDLNGDLIDEIITVPEKGNPAQIRYFDYNGEPQFTPGYYAFGILPTGADVAAGDLNYDGQDEVVAVPGPGYPAQVRIFDYTGEPTLNPGFYAYPQNVTSGFHVAVGDFDKNGSSEIVTSPRTGASAHIRTFRYNGEPVFSPGFFAYNEQLRIGADVAVLNIFSGANVNVNGDLVYWDQDAGMATVENYGGLFYAVKPFWYELVSGDKIQEFENAESQSVERFLRDNRIRIIPILSNEQHRQPLADIIGDPTRRERHVNDIVNLVLENNYDGISINYENLEAQDKNNFTTFMEELADSLHYNGKLLAVHLHAKTSEPGTWGGPQAQDWSALGAVCDQMKIMAYDYSWSTSTAGPIAPYNWVNQVLEHAVDLIPREKIYLGIPLYGYDWVDSMGEGLTYTQARERASKFHAQIRWSDEYRTNYYDYYDHGVRHDVYFANARSTEQRLELAKDYSIGGVEFWRLGGEDPETWRMVEEVF